MKKKDKQKHNGPKSWTRTTEKSLSKQARLVRTALGQERWTEWLQKLESHWRDVLTHGATTDKEGDLLQEMRQQEKGGKYQPTEWQPSSLAKWTLLKELIDFTEKLVKAGGSFERITINEAQLNLKAASICTVEYDGKTIDISISGAVRITGHATVVKTNGRVVIVTVFQRFIGKTFWQYCFHCEPQT